MSGQVRNMPGQVRNMPGQVRNMSGQVRNMSGKVRNMPRVRKQVWERLCKLQTFWTYFLVTYLVKQACVFLQGPSLLKIKIWSICSDIGVNKAYNISLNSHMTKYWPLNVRNFNPRYWGGAKGLALQIMIMIRMRTFDKDLRPGPGLRSVTSVLVGSIQHYFFLLVLDIGSQIRESSFRKFFNILVSFCYIGNYFSLFTTNIFSLSATLCTRLCEEHIRRIVLDKKIN